MARRLPKRAMTTQPGGRNPNPEFLRRFFHWMATSTHVIPTNW
jgi:hypothetical protein